MSNYTEDMKREVARLRGEAAGYKKAIKMINENVYMRGHPGAVKVTEGLESEAKMARDTAGLYKKELYERFAITY